METAIIVKSQEKHTYSVPILGQVEIFGGIPKINRAFDAVCIACEINRDRLKNNHSRKRDVVIGRQMVWKIVREEDQHIALKTLGEFFGKFDHTTVIHGVTAITNAMMTDEALVKKYKTAVHLFSFSDQYEEIDYYTYKEPTT